MKKYNFLLESFNKKLLKFSNNIEGNDINAVLNMIKELSSRIMFFRAKISRLKSCRTSNSKINIIQNQKNNLENKMFSILNKLSNNNSKNLRKINLFGVDLYVLRNGDVYTNGKHFGFYKIKPMIKDGKPPYIKFVDPVTNKNHNISLGRLVSRVYKDNNTETSVIKNSITDRPFTGTGSNFIIKHLDGNVTNNTPENLTWVRQLNQGFKKIETMDSESLMALSRKYNIPYQTLHARYSKGLRGSDLICVPKFSGKHTMPVEGFPSLKAYLLSISEKTGISYPTLKKRWQYGFRGEKLSQPLR